MNRAIKIIKHFGTHSRLKHFLAAFALFFFLTGCGSKDESQSDEDAASKVRSKIEVNVISPRIGKIAQYETLNATTEYMLSDACRAPIDGYIRKVNISPGQEVKEGDILFSMQSKEATAINIIKDTSLHINGTVFVKATESGVVKAINRQLGDYVQDGDQLCNIENTSSLVFILNVPFEMHRYIKQGESYIVTLPDGESVKAYISARIPEMDKAVQMERYVLRTAQPLSLPSGLIANVQIPTTIQTDAVILPKAAILCNEVQSKFWVMKLIHDTLAIKVPIDKGAETKDSVEVKSPAFSQNDKILVSGNYGLPDTALVKVIR